jgi:polyisoprenoid-binding protein YceI
VTARAFGLGLCLAALAAWQAAAQARAWRVDPEASVIDFVYTLNERPASGRFVRVAGEGTFDRDRPAEARLELRIDVESLKLGDPVVDAFAKSVEWFDAAGHPTAVYRLARLTPRDDGRYEALGDLTIKGRLQVVRTPLVLQFDADERGALARAQGALQFDRRDFNVGVGASALFVSLGTQVAVRFAIVARPAP